MYKHGQSINPGGGGGERVGSTPREKGRDARRLAYGYKFLILVSFRVFWAKRNHM